MKIFERLLKLMPYDNPYMGFDYSAYPCDISGGVAHAIFEPVIRLFQGDTNTTKPGQFQYHFQSSY